ncbi:MAG: 2-dehydropantoate 2-reductase [Kordia sp.]|nr:MAG: 2-dehydropantoate 2-reductase [Kordia sp.]
MNIVVFGTGGVGGYFGAKLHKAGFKVTFVARGKQLEAIKNKGLQIKSINGDFTIHPEGTDDIQNLTSPDLIILGVKSWQVAEAAETIRPIVHKTTMVLPLQNGADNADKLRAVLNTENILAGLCKIVSKVEDYGVINHFAYDPEIIFGEYNNEQTARVKQLKSVFDRAGFKNKLSENIHLDIWRKYMFITTVSGIGALTRSSFGVMKQNGEIMEMMLKTAQEIKQIANAKEIPISDADVERTLKMFHQMPPKTTASMQRDLMEKKPSELENFNGYIVQQGLELSIETPVNSFIYNCLLPQENSVRATL